MYPSKVTITEVGPRDGLQSETAFVPTERKIDLVRRCAAAGLRGIEATSFVSPRAVPQLADADAVAAASVGHGFTVSALVPNERGALRAVAAGVDEMVVFISASESHSRTNLNMAVDDAVACVGPVAEIARVHGKRLRGAVAVAFGCPFEGDVAPTRVSGLVARLAEHGIDAITLGDTTGMASPPHVERLCECLREDHPGIGLTLHLHNTRGLALANAMAALQIGIDRFESSIAGLGGCPFAPGATGNVCTEDLVYLLSELDIETGIDLDALIEVARDIERLLGRRLPGQIMHAGSRYRRYPSDSVRRAVG